MRRDRGGRWRDEGWGRGMGMRRVRGREKA